MIALNQKLLSVLIMSVGLTISLMFFIAAQASSPFDITFPIPELNNCANEAECRSYCDNPANAEGCLEFAQKHGLAPKEELERARKLADIENGPGGCNSQSSCEKYCNDINHIDECIDFAEANGFLAGDELQEAEKVRAAVKRGVPTPGNCSNKDACEEYCADSAHIEECLAFGEEAGFIGKDELEQARKFLPLMQRGETPGGCRTKEACESYCEDENNFEQCLTFAEKAGFISGQDLEMARKTGGRGPGGCKGRQCKDFCENPANQKACFEFAKEHGLIKEEDLRRMEEGQQHLRRSLDEMPPQVRECLATIIGPEGLSQIESGTFFGGPELGEKMKACFEQFRPNFEGRPEGGPPEGFEHGVPGGQFQGPGGCSSPEECKAFCEASPEACRGFGPPQRPESGSFPEFQRPPEEFGPPPGFEGQLPPEGFQPSSLPGVGGGLPSPEGFYPTHLPEGSTFPSGEFNLPSPEGSYPQFPSYTPPPEGSYTPPPSYPTSPQYYPAPSDSTYTPPPSSFRPPSQSLFGSVLHTIFRILP